MDKAKEYEKELKKETDMFLSVCNKEDARALILYKEKDGTEDIARIATLTIVFGFKKLFFKIMAKMSQESANECIARITEVMNDFETINKWVTEFISKSMSEKFSILRTANARFACATYIRICDVFSAYSHFFGAP